MKTQTAIKTLTKEGFSQENINGHLFFSNPVYPRVIELVGALTSEWCYPIVKRTVTSIGCEAEKSLIASIALAKTSF